MRPKPSEEWVKSNSQTSALHPLISMEALSKGKRFCTWIGKTELLVLTTENGIRVYSGMCPHQGGPLGEGKIHKNRLICPWHGCAFELDEGKCVAMGSCTGVSGMHLRPVRFEIREGMVYVDATQ